MVLILEWVLVMFALSFLFVYVYFCCINEQGVTMDDCVEISREFARRASEELHIPM